MIDYDPKYFIRILKDIGLYHVWIKERKKYIFNTKRHLFPNLRKTFAEIICDSFYWENTSNEMLWHNLYYSGVSYNFCHRIVNDDKCIEKLKKTIDDSLFNKN